MGDRVTGEVGDVGKKVLTEPSMDPLNAPLRTPKYIVQRSVEMIHLNTNVLLYRNVRH